MTCPRCQTPTLPGAKYCQECATPLVQSCAKCGGELSVVATLCPHCQQPTEVPGTVTAAPRFAAPFAYTPRHLAESILTSRAAMEGERKQVTVLFADLKGSMEMLADRDPEDAQRILDAVLEVMMEAVHRYEGTVNQVMGDGIMALFGAPLAHEDHGVRACYAALRMQESVKRYAEEARRSLGINVQIRIGLNSGEVVVRAIGNDLRMDYTAVGQSTHLAARMEQLSIPGSTLLTAHTLELAEGFVRVKPIGPVRVKGLSEPIEVYELTGAGPLRTRFDAAVIRGLTRFVGREVELHRLRSALQTAGQGHGQAVAVVGEPGVGKSRLFFEFTHSEWVQEWRILESGSVSYGKATPHLPVVDLLKVYFRIESGDDPAVARAKVADRIATLHRSLEPSVSALLAPLDLPIDDPHWLTLEPPQRRQRTLDAVKRLLLGESRIQPLLLVLEDLHSSDSETQALMDVLVDSLPGSRMLLLVNYRPEYEDPWAAKAGYTRMRIDPLPPQGAEALLGALLGDDTTVGPLKQLLVERTEGNPFFLEESVRSLAETHVLVGQRGTYRLAGPLTAIQVPATVQAVLAARIDRLPLEDKRLLQTAAVIGEKVPLALLMAIAEASRDGIHRELAHLQAAGFLYEAPLSPAPEYLFKHGLTHQVAYQSLVGERRRLLHARIVKGIERLYPDRLAEHAEALAHHALRGEVWDLAVRYLRQAGTRAIARSAYREAVVCLEQALGAVGRRPQCAETLETAIDVRLDLHTALLPLGEFDRIFEHLRAAGTLAEAHGDQARLGRIRAYQTDYFRQIGEYHQAIEAGTRALTIARALGDLPLEVATNTYLGHAHYGLGDHRRAAQYLRANVDALVGPLGQERLGLPYVAAVHSRTWLVFCHAELGEFAEATVIGGEGLSLAEATNHPLSLASACWGLGRLHLLQGNVAQAISILERGLLLSRAENVRLLLPALASSLGSAYTLSGRLGEAVPLLEEAVVEHAAMRRTAGQSGRLILLSRAYLRAGRTEEAIGLARRALDLARGHRERAHQAYALHLLGEIAAQTSPRDPEEAVGHLLEARALAHALGMRPLEAHCLTALGPLHARAGQQVAAERDLAEAAALCRQMNCGPPPNQ